MKGKKPFVFALLLLSIGCGDPSRWAEELELKLQCDMNIEQVRSLAKYPIMPSESGKPWVTHYITDDDGTQMSLGFENGKLKYDQIYWARRMTRYAYYEKMDLCRERKMDQGSFVKP